MTNRQSAVGQFFNWQGKFSISANMPTFLGERQLSLEVVIVCFYPHLSLRTRDSPIENLSCDESHPARMSGFGIAHVTDRIRSSYRSRGEL